MTHLKLHHQKTKLAPKCYGPFQITKEISPVAYQINGEEEYEVERIINHQCYGRSKKLQYLVKWLNYPEADNTWEPADQVHAPELVKAYHQHTPLAKIKAITTNKEKTCPFPHKLLKALLAATSPPHHISSSFQKKTPITSSFSSATATSPVLTVHIAYCISTSVKTSTAPFTTPTAIKSCLTTLST